VTLVCNPYVSSIDNYPDVNYDSLFKHFGVSYGCGDFFSDRNVLMPYNERCLVEIGLNKFGLNTNSIYDCYQYANDTDFDGFLSEVNNSIVYRDGVCNSTDDNFGNDYFRYPEYHYTPLVFSTDNSAVSTNTVWLEGANPTKDFNETSAIRASIYSVLDTNPDLDYSSACILNDNWNIYHTSLLLTGFAYFFLCN